MEPALSDNNQLDLIWTAQGIAAAIGIPLRATYHLLETESLPGAKRVGGKWCISRRALMAIFEPAAAA